MEFKTCRQCGEMQPLTNFRSYYGNRKGTYTMCKTCERINSREKYLTAKGESLSYEEEAELEKIHKLYEAQTARGLRPPRSVGGKASLVGTLDEMLDKYAAVPAIAPGLNIADAPQELLKWLSTTLDREPEYYLDEVYDDLRTKFMPIKRVDYATKMPVYDSTYKDILDRILDRFNEYEDNYYSEED